MMKLSVSSYSFAQYIRAGKLTQFDTVRAAHELGFEGIEFTDLSPVPRATVEEQKDFALRLREEAERYGLPICAYAIGANLAQLDPEAMSREVERLKGQVDVAALLGAPVMRHDVCYSLPRGMSFDRMLPVMAAAIREVADYAAGKGVTTCSENHGFIAQDSDRMERLYNAVAHGNYGLLVDVGNFACADEDCAIAVSRVASYAVHVHTKDFIVTPFGKEAPAGSFESRGGNALLGTVVGEGDIPVAQTMAILRKAGYDGFCSIEFEGREDCMEALAKGLSNLRAMMVK